MKVKKRPDYADATQFVPQANVWPLGVTPFAVRGSETSLMNCATCGHRMMSHGTIRNLSGLRVLCPGDWVITHADGQQSVCKMDQFDSIYLPAQEKEYEPIHLEG